MQGEGGHKPQEAKVVGGAEARGEKGGGHSAAPARPHLSASAPAGADGAAAAGSAASAGSAAAANGGAGAPPGGDLGDPSQELWELEQAVAQLQGLKRHMQTDLCAQVMVELLTVIVDDLCFDVCADIHRSHRMHMLPTHSPADQPGNRVVDAPGYDIHGQVPEKVPKNEYFNCAHCHQKVAASRYTDHLSKCMLNRGRAARSRNVAAPESGAGGPSTSPANPGRNLSSPSHFGNSHSGANLSPSVGAATSRIAAVSPVQPKHLQSSTSPPQHQLPGGNYPHDGGLGKRAREDAVAI